MTDTFLIAGCLRRTGTNTFVLLDDSDHTPLNCSPTVTVTNGSSAAGYVTITYGPGVKVGSLVVSPDEGFAQAGYSAGGSVGASSANIQFGLNGTAIAPNSIPATSTANFWFIGVMYGTITPPPSVTTIYSTTLNANEEDWDGYNLRVRIPRAKITSSASKTVARLYLQAATTAATTLGSCWLGFAASSGNGWKFASAPVQIKKSTSGTISIASGTTVTSDDASFVDDGVSDLLVHLYFTDADFIRRMNGTGVGSLYYKLGTDDGSALDPSGYTGSSSNPSATAVITKIEVA